MMLHAFDAYTPNGSDRSQFWAFHLSFTHFVVGTNANHNSHFLLWQLNTLQEVRFYPLHGSVILTEIHFQITAGWLHCCKLMCTNECNLFFRHKSEVRAEVIFLAAESDSFVCNNKFKGKSIKKVLILVQPLLTFLWKHNFQTETQIR